jgi:hypothetical protein
VVGGRPILVRPFQHEIYLGSEERGPVTDLGVRDLVADRLLLFRVSSHGIHRQYETYSVLLPVCKTAMTVKRHTNIALLFQDAVRILSRFVVMYVNIYF